MTRNCDEKKCVKLEGNNAYERLLEKDSQYKAKLDKLYELCEKRLSEIPTLFPNYTYHDIGHAARVANYMADFIAPQIDKISDFHLFMILAAALMHDTGMFVSIKEKNDEIENRIEKGMSHDEAEVDFQNYIRKNHSERVAEVFNDNEYNEIFKDFSGSNVVGDLTVICQSHTKDIKWICDNIDTDREYKEYNYNPQQIAMLLILGDNLDFDQRRAPSYMLDMLGIEGFSKSEWEKHASVTNYEKVVHKADSIFELKFFGVEKSIEIYRNTLKHIRWLANTAERISNITKNYKKEYAFEIENTINEVTADGFQHSDLEFKLDYNKVLKLLMGEHIYNSKKDGIRELLQNSIDAVMVMKEYYEEKGRTSDYSPIIRVILNKKENKIKIIDNGTGMSKDILTNYFFKIGESYYSSDEFKSLQGRYNPSGRFGIGFMACFMLSDHVTLETKQCNGESWIYQFDKECDFTIEKKIHNLEDVIPHGTCVTLDYNKAIPNIFTDENEIINYIDELIIADGFELEITTSDGQKHNVRSRKNDDIGMTYIKNDEFEVTYHMSSLPNLIYDLDGFEEVTGVPDVFLYFNDDAWGVNYKLVSDMESALIEYESNLEEAEGVYNMSHFISHLGDIKDEEMKSIFMLWQQYIRINEIDSTKLSCLMLELVMEHNDFEIVKIPYLASEKHLGVYREAKEKMSGDEKNLLEEIGIFDFKTFFVIKKSGTIIDDEDLKEMADYVITSSDAVDKASYIGEFPYPFDEQRIDYIYEKIGKGYLISEKDVDVVSRISDMKIYMNGILVKDEHPVLPSLMIGTRFDYLSVNVKSREYTLNLARSKFDDETREKMWNSFLNYIYEDVKHIIGGKDEEEDEEDVA